MDASAEGEENLNSDILTEDESLIRDRLIRRSGSGSFLGPEESDDEIAFRGCNRNDGYSRY